MKKLCLVALAASFVLTACASGPSAYGPAKSYDDIGYKNTKIQHDKFRISYTGRHIDEARDYALLRAAQVTLNEGYSHFEIVGGDDWTNGRNPIGTAIGVGVGNGGYRGRRTHVDLGVGVHDVTRMIEGDKAKNTIEVVLLGTASQGPNIYDAQSVASSIKPPVFK